MQKEDVIVLPLLRKKEMEISVDDIIYFEANNSVCKVYCQQSNSKPVEMVINSSLRNISQLLPDANFFRVHRSYIVNLNYVDGYGTYPGKTISLNEGEIVIPLAKRRRLDFHKKFLKIKNKVLQI